LIEEAIMEVFVFARLHALHGKELW